jgi:hypothetical protein
VANRAACVDGHAAAGNVNDSTVTKPVLVAICAPVFAPFAIVVGSLVLFVAIIGKRF